MPEASGVRRISRSAVIRACLGCCALGVVSLFCAPAWADDWLALLPACSMPAASAPSLELVYPHVSLPALIEVGDVLVARIRVPAALTPPPGVQQERALRGWAAELVGQGIALGASVLQHRHGLPILAVRPDEGSSLVYRVRMVVPAYAAPGTYTLVLRTPFGERLAEGAVHVVARGLRSRAPLVPAVALAGRTLALRVGNELWVSAVCPAERASFEAEVRATLLFERRTRVALDRRSLPLMAAQVADSDELQHLGWQRTQNELQIDNAAAHTERSVLLLLPASSSVQVSNARLELYPASDLSLRRITVISGVLTVSPGARAKVELGRVVARERPLVLEPSVTESGVTTRLRVLGAAREARVAFDYGFARSAFSGPEWMADFAGPLQQPLRALVLTPSGGGELVRQQLVVTAHRPPSCAIGPGAPHGLGLCAWLGCLLGLGILLKRRPAGWVWE
jgi:hypothetical protein